MAKRRKTRRKSKSKRRKNPKRVRAGKKAARKRKRGPKRRKKNKSTKPRKKSMAKGGIRSKLQSPLLKKVLMAAGLASIATAVASLVLPGQAQLINSPIVKAGLGFAVGDIPGALTNFLLSGGVGSLTGGGNGAATSTQQQAASGFA